MIIEKISPKTKKGVTIHRKMTPQIGLSVLSSIKISSPSKIVATTIISIASFIAGRHFYNMSVIKQIAVFLIIALVMTAVRHILIKKAAVLTLLFQGLLLLVEFFAYMFVKIMVPDI